MIIKYVLYLLFIIIISIINIDFTLLKEKKIKV